MAYARTIYAYEVKALKQKDSDLHQSERVLTAIGAEAQAETVRAVRATIKSIAEPNGHDFLEQLPKE